MKVSSELFVKMSGKLDELYYMRTNSDGTMSLCKKPRFELTKAVKENRRRFVEKYGQKGPRGPRKKSTNN